MITYKINRKGFNTLFNTMFAIVKTAPASFLVVEIRKHTKQCQMRHPKSFRHEAIFMIHPYKKVLSSACSRRAKVLGTNALCYNLYY